MTPLQLAVRKEDSEILSVIRSFKPKFAAYSAYPTIAARSNERTRNPKRRTRDTQQEGEGESKGSDSEVDGLEPPNSSKQARFREPGAFPQLPSMPASRIPGGTALCNNILFDSTDIAGSYQWVQRPIT